MTLPLSSPKLPKTDIKRVAILFSGGPAPSANAVIGSAVIAFDRAGIEVLGLKNGYTHLCNYKPGDELKEGVAFTILKAKDMEGVRSSGGIIIGTARANPGKKLKDPADLKNPEKTAPLKTVYDALSSLGVDALISIGGDDTLTTAAKFKLFQDTLPEGDKRIKVVHLPKTIDNDYKGIDFTFGYFTAVEMLSIECRNLLEDAKAAGASFIVQVMGRKAAWLAYGAAIAAESSLVIGLEDIPFEWKSTEPTVEPATGEVVKDEKGEVLMREIFDIGKIVSHIADVFIARQKEGKPYNVVIMSEGIAEYLPLDEMKKCLSEDEFQSLKPDSFGHFPVSQLKYSSRIGRLVSEEIERRNGSSVKVNGLQFGYEIRCHRPTAFDICLGSQLGTGAFRALAEKGLNGVMVSVKGELELTFEEFEGLIDYSILRAHQRPIRPFDDFHQLARYMEVRVD